MTEFDEDTALTAIAPGRWKTDVTDRWSIGAGPNGGYIASFLIRAMSMEAEHPDPLTMTTHFLARPQEGPAMVTVEHLRRARSHHFMDARLLQGERLVAVATATFGRLRFDDPVSRQGEVPEPPRPDRAIPVAAAQGPDMTFRERFEYRVAESTDMPYLLAEPGPARAGGWTRFSDGRALDAVAVPLFMDSWPPPMFATFPGATAPTIELTVYWRGRPATPWHLTDFRSRFLQNGYTEEDGELWDENGQLVAQSRQLARVTLPSD